MPKAESKHTLLRQWEMLSMIPKFGAGITAKELAYNLQERGFDVDLRQIQRDLPSLQEIFPLECNDKSKPFGWRWIKGSSVDIQGMTIAEALSLKITENNLKALLPGSVYATVQGKFKQAENLLNSNKTKATKWLDKVFTALPALPMNVPNITPEVLENVQQALLNQKQIMVNYQSVDSEEPREYILHPLGLVQQGNILYLVATAFNYDDVRIYGIHRMSKAHLQNESGTYPYDFKLKEYVQKGAFQFGSNREIKLRLKVTENLKRLLTETPLSDNQTIKTNNQGHDILTATTKDTWQLFWWLLSQSTELEVLSPAATRRKIKEELIKNLAQYND